MINYNSKKWWEVMGHFKTSWVIRRTIRMVWGMATFATFIVIFDYLISIYPELFPFEAGIMAIEPSIFSLLGIFLSLMMVFRTNTAYDRWWEGRKQWGALINHTRGLAVLYHGMLRRDDHVNRKYFATAISSYVLSLSDHLRDISQHNWIKAYSEEPHEEIEKIKHVPNKIVNDIYERTENLYKDGFFDGFQLVNIKPETQSFLDIQGACERIKATPIPFAHNFFIKLFIFTYCALLPFVLVPKIGVFAIILTAFASYALIGLEFISVEIEEPFGLDCNDLPTRNLAEKIQGNVHEILGVEMEAEEKPKVGQYVVIN